MEGAALILRLTHVYICALHNSGPVFCVFLRPLSCAQPIHYRTNPKDSRNPNFCVRCFELIINKNFVTASKMGKKYFTFATFLWNPFLRRVLRQKKCFCIFFLCFGDWS